LQPDPIVPEPGNSQAFDRFAYVSNNPVKYLDPTGHWLETAWDIANIVWDIYEVKNDPSALNIVALVADVAATVAPAVPAGVGLIVRGGKAVKTGTKVASRTFDFSNFTIDAIRAFRGKGIHPATTGKAFSDWFKVNILKNPLAKGKQVTFRGLILRFDIVLDNDKVIYELKTLLKTPVLI